MHAPPPAASRPCATGPTSRAWRAAVYPTPDYVSSLATSTPVSEHVQVDAELRGCPIDPGQLLELLTALRIGRRPQLPGESVCLECKRRGNVCVLVAGGSPAWVR